MTATTTVSSEEKTFVPIYRTSLVTNTVMEFDVYARFGNRYVLFRAKDLVYTGEIPEDIARELQDILFIKSDEKQQYVEYLEKNLQTIVEDPEVEDDAKATVLVETSKNVVSSLFQNPEVGQSIQRASSVVELTVDFVLHGAGTVQNLLALCSHDYHTYSHCVNVSVYTIALARQLNRPGARLREIGLGAIVHDVGKIRIDKSIINKEGPLDYAEFEEIKKHPTYSHEILTEEGLPEPITAPGHEHHERVAGGGYPRGIRGDEMHLNSKICAVCDTFDALTTHRPYRKAFTSYDALRIMNNEMRGSFDPEILRDFVLLMAGN